MASKPPHDSNADTIRAAQMTRPGSGIMTAEIPPDLGMSPGLRYRPLRVLGAGGMGEVTLVLDEVIGREVALKRLKPDIQTDPEAREAFAREAILQGRLEHPSIVPVYDVTIGPDGTLFFTMRRVDGRSLAAAMKELSRQRLLTAFDQVCLAAHFAHEKGIVHRDIKPDNIMLGRYGEVYLLDWGIARIAAGAAGDSSAGTLGYMSPEQARGSRDLDARSDVYALGAILFEILTGQPLHPAAPLADMLAQIGNGADARPSVRAPAADVPPELETICVKATALDREHRYDSARELSDAIQRYLEGDRDLAMRARMSHEHAMRAAELATAGTVQARSEALGAVGRALALDPGNADALRTMVGLLTAPPEHPPPEAVVEMHANERVLDHARSRAGAISLTAWALMALFGPLIWGVHDRAELAIMVAGACVACVMGWIRLRRTRPDGFIPTYHVVGIAAAIAGMGIGLSPNFMTPTLAALFTIACTLSIDGARRLLPLAIIGAAVTVPYLLEWLGVMSPSLVERGDLLCLVPRGARLPQTNEIGQWVFNLVIVGAGSLYALRFRSALSDMQRRSSINAWQLRQLVPTQRRA